MNISSMGAFPVGKAHSPAGGLKLNKIVSQLNARVWQKNQRLDVIAFHGRLERLAKPEEPEAKRETADAASGDPAASYNGSRTTAEWAELSLTNQRNGLRSLSDALEFQKEKLANAMRQMEKYERIAAGEFPGEDLDWIAYQNGNVSSDADWAALRKKEAAEMAQRYRESIPTDFTEVIRNRLGIYDTFSNAYDEYSGGLASQVAGGLLNGLTPEGLGLTGLSGRPEEVLAALTAAQEKLGQAAESLEGAFAEAVGKEMRAFDAPPDREMWGRLIELDDMMTRRRSVDMVVGTHTLSMDKTLLAELL